MSCAKVEEGKERLRIKLPPSRILQNLTLLLPLEVVEEILVTYATCCPDWGMACRRPRLRRIFVSSNFYPVPSLGVTFFFPPTAHLLRYGWNKGKLGRLPLGKRAQSFHPLFLFLAMFWVIVLIQSVVRLWAGPAVTKMNETWFFSPRMS